MHTILWQFEVRDDKTTEFLRAYGIEGEWAQLFRRAEGYQGTELLRSTSKPNCFITIDRWSSSEDFDNFQRQYGAKYSALDAALSELTVSDPGSALLNQKLIRCQRRRSPS